MIAHAKDEQPLCETALVAQGDQSFDAQATGNTVIAAPGLGAQLSHHQQFAAIGGLPTEYWWARRRTAAPHEQSLHRAARINRGNRVGVAKAIRHPIPRHVLGGEVQVVAHPGARLQQVTRKALARGAIAFAFDPMAGDDFPAASAYLGGNLLKQCGFITAQNLVNRHLRLEEGECRKLVHQREHGAYRVAGGGHGLGPAPLPVHVDVRVTDAVQRIALGCGCDRG